jgi:hypothetical protein
LTPAIQIVGVDSLNYFELNLDIIVLIIRLSC